MSACGRTGHGQGIDLAEVGVHEERTTLTRQITHRQLEELAGIAELHAPSIE
ncbi:hypothetical protein D3C76_1013180 [compost metagenome]